MTSPATVTEAILAFDPKRTTNARLMTDMRDIGYLSDDVRVLDCTYGHGAFWRDWEPTKFAGCDLDVEKSPFGYSVDFTNLPFRDRSFGVVVFDPPYKLAGTPHDVRGIDELYGVHELRKPRELWEMVQGGISQSCRVSSKIVIVKCKDQVGGSLSWQTHMVAQQMSELGFVLEDMLYVIAYRPQPSGTRQLHARRNYSAGMVFRRKGVSL